MVGDHAYARVHDVKAHSFRDAELLGRGAVNLDSDVGKGPLNVLNRQRFLQPTHGRLALRVEEPTTPYTRCANERPGGARKGYGAHLCYPMFEVEDAIGQHLELVKAPTRVVSLVPSETVSVFDLVGRERLIGRTDYCVEPAGAIEAVPTVGGTKRFDVQAVVDLKPDLVLANKEENSRALVMALIEAGLKVHVSFPCTVADSNRYLANLCQLLDVNPDESPHLRRCREAAARAEASSTTKLIPVFVPIWRDPWMTFDGRAYASDVLRLAGAHNVFAGRPRRYPLAADLGKGVAWTEEKVDQRDTRYPRVRLEEVVERGARAVLLPDEPYAFSEKDFAAFRELESSSKLDLELIDGKDVFWYGTRVIVAIDRLRACIDRLGQ